MDTKRAESYLAPKLVICCITLLLVIYIAYHELLIESVAGCWDCGWETRDAVLLFGSAALLLMPKWWAAALSFVASIKVIVWVGMVAFWNNIALKTFWPILKSSVAWSYRGHPEFFVEIGIAFLLTWTSANYLFDFVAQLSRSDAQRVRAAIK